MIDYEEMKRVLDGRGLRVATMSEAVAGKSTHAICEHGIVAPIDGDDHSCVWLRCIDEIGNG